jgi:hypothetical protein
MTWPMASLLILLLAMAFVVTMEARYERDGPLPLAVRRAGTAGAGVNARPRGQPAKKEQRKSPAGRTSCGMPTR